MSKLYPKSTLNKFFFSAILFFAFTAVYSQNIAINTTGAGANGTALLHIGTGTAAAGGDTKGILIPRVALTGTGDVTTITPAPGVTEEGLIVYNTATAGVSPNNVVRGYYFWNGTKWIAFSGTGGRDWGLLGNGGTVDGTNFIGTTDNIPFNIRVFNQKAGRIESSATTAGTNFGYQTGNSNTNGAPQNTFIGYMAGAATNNSLVLPLFNADSNTFVGANTGKSNTTGEWNTAVGAGALYSNTTGPNNTAVGQETMKYNINGHDNTAIGSYALKENTSGGWNTSMGAGGLWDNTSGNQNTSTGLNALRHNTIGSQNSATGMDAMNANISGNYNAAFGNTSLWNNTTGNYNTALGFGADVNSNNLSYATAIGAGAKVSTSNSLILGGTGTYSVNVGIGLNNPGWPLDIVRDQNYYTLAAMHNSNAGTSAATGIIMFNDVASSHATFGISSSGFNLAPYAILGMNKAFWNAGSASNGIIINNEAAVPIIFATSFTERMRVDGNGNVGIGTSSPAYNLCVYGANPSIAMYNGFDPLTTGLYKLYCSGNAMHLQQNTAVAGDFSTLNYLMTWKNGGKVGINNSTPAEALDVTGNIRFSGALMPNNAAGTSGQVLKSAGAGSPPTWGSSTTVGTMMLIGKTTAIETATTFPISDYQPLVGANGVQNFDASARQRNIVSKAGTLRNLYIIISGGLGAAPDNLTFTIMKNGVATTITCAITGAAVTTTSDLVNSVAVAAGDEIGIRISSTNDPTTHQYVSWSVDYDF